MSVVLVTGSAGFLGSRLLKLWNGPDEVLGIDVTNADYELDLCNFDAILKVILDVKPRLIIHLAAESHVVRPDNIHKMNHHEMLGRNVTATYNILRAAGHLVHTDCSIILAGSAVEYGNWPPGEDLPDEYSTPEPTESYGLSKTLGTLLSQYADNPATVLRFSNIYGPGQRNKFIPLVIKTALSGGQLILHGKGRQTRQWLYVDDAVRAIQLAAARGISICNITTPEEVSVREVAVMVYNALQNECLQRGRQLPIMDLRLEEEGGGDARICMDPSLAFTQLQWRPEVSLEDGIKYTVIQALEDERAYRQIAKYS